MTSQAAIEPGPIAVISGVDTPENTPYAAAVDDHGRLLGHREFPANDGGYAALLNWVESHGRWMQLSSRAPDRLGRP